MRQVGSRNTLVKVDYDLIGDLAGIAGDTAKQYAHRGEYDSRCLDSVLRWVNGRRAAKGLSLIGKRSPQGGARANLPWPFYRYRLSFAATIRRARVTCFRSAL